jgi:hypothetical protein
MGTYDYEWFDAQIAEAREHLRRDRLKQASAIPMVAMYRQTGGRVRTNYEAFKAAERVLGAGPARPPVAASVLTLTAEERRGARNVAAALHVSEAQAAALMLERKRDQRAQAGGIVSLAASPGLQLTAEERRMARQAAGSAPGAVERFEVAMLERKRERAMR